MSLGATLQVGKFPAGLLERLLAKNHIQDSAVVLGPLVGEDAAALEIGGRLLVAASDPVTFASDQAGWYAVQVNANDVACSGALPRWFLATLLVPEGYPEAQAEAIFDQVKTSHKKWYVFVIHGLDEIDLQCFDLAVKPVESQQAGLCFIFRQ